MTRAGTVILHLIALYFTLYYTALYPVLHCTLHCTTLHCTLYCTVLCTILHCTVPCTALHCALHCTVNFTSMWVIIWTIQCSAVALLTVDSLIVSFYLLRDDAENLHKEVCPILHYCCAVQCKEVWCSWLTGWNWFKFRASAKWRRIPDVFWSFCFLMMLQWICL